MTILRRGSHTFHLMPSLWDALQLLARQEGWRPAGAVDVRNGERYSIYARDRVVSKVDAEGFAAALERFVNGERADRAEPDLVLIVGLVNFLRGGVFEIL